MRFFCFGGGGHAAHDAEWAARAQYGQPANAPARARVLEVLEEELEARFAALAHVAYRASQDDAHLRRLYQASLPTSEMNLCKDLLRKLAAIDHAREAAEADQQQLQAQLKVAEAAHRQAEFARARAEAIATSRGEALMHAQQQQRELERTAENLGYWLSVAMKELGYDISDLTPSKSMVTPPGLGSDSTTPGPRQSIFSQKQLAEVAASLSRLPRQVAGAQEAAEHSQQQKSRFAEEGQTREPGAVAEQQQQQQRYRNSQGQQQEPEQQQGQRRSRSRRQSQQSNAGHADEAGAALQRGASVAAGLAGPGPSHDGSTHQQEGQRPTEQLCGFTVYTNSLQSGGVSAADGGSRDHGGVSKPQWLAEQEGVAGGPLESEGSGVQWRSISSAALSTRSADSGDHHRHDQQEGGQRQRQEHQSSAAGSRGSAQQQQMRGSVNSLERPAAATAAAEAAKENKQPAAAAHQQQQQEAASNKLQQHAQQLSKLVLPGLDASQLDSLVRIGASMQSPDSHPMAVLQQLLPPGWEDKVQREGAANPLQGSEDAERLLTDLPAEWQQRTAGDVGNAASMATSRSGSRRVSQDGAAAAAGAGASGAWQQQPATRAGVTGGRTGSALPPELQVLFADGKLPGAGTWVSPSLAAMIAHKKGFNPLLGEPSPPSHIKAVFGTSQDKEFYGPMAAHMNKREQPIGQQAPAAVASSRPPSQVSAESIRGPQRQQPASNRSSVCWEPEQRQQQQHTAAAAAGRVQVPAAGAGSAVAPRSSQPPSAAGSRAGSQHGGSAIADTQGAVALQQHQHQHPQPAPERRQAAMIHRFQPMGAHHHQHTTAASAAAAAATTQQQAQQPATQQQQQLRHSNVTVNQLGAGTRRSSGSAADGDTSLAAAALSRATLRGSGGQVPLPRAGHHHQASMPMPAPAGHHHHHQQQQQSVATKRSLDSMRGSKGAGGSGSGSGGSVAADHISASAMHAVEAAMAALREANPHLRESTLPLQQQQQPHAQVHGGSRQAAPTVGARPPYYSAHHTRTKSLPDADLTALAEDPASWQLTQQQQRRQQQHMSTNAPASRTSAMYRY